MSDPVDALAAFLRHDSGTYDRLTADVDAKTIASLFAAAFFLAVDEHFADRPTPAIADVVQLVADVRAQYDTSGDELDPRTAERLIRSIVFDDERLVDGLDGRAIGRVQPAVVATIAEGWDEAHLDRFLAELRDGLARRGQ